MNGSDIFYIVFLVGSSALCGLTYGLFFNQMSETTMVQISFGWVFFLVTGGLGMVFKSHRSRHLIAFLGGTFALTALSAFFILIWPAL